MQVDPIKQVNGSLEFCQEFFDDVRAAARLRHRRRERRLDRRPRAARARAQRGRRRLALRERPQLPRRGRRRRASTLSSSKLVTDAGNGRRPGGAPARRRGARARRRAARPGAARHRSAWDRCARRPVRRDHQAVHRHLGRAQDHHPAHLAGPDARHLAGRAPRPSDAASARTFLERQATSLAGGSNEIQRNLIAERVLGMPREWAADRDIPYKDVRSNAMPTAPTGA